MEELPSIETESRYCGIQAKNVAQYTTAMREGRPMCIEAGTDIDYLDFDDFPYIGMDCPEDLDEVTVWSFAPGDPVDELERFRSVLRSQFKTTPWYCYARVQSPSVGLTAIGVFQPIPS